MDNKNRYKNYFKNHYQNTFSLKDIENYRNWFFTQWKFINSKIRIDPQSKILEIGSGLGGFYSYLEEAGIKRYIGLEVDRQASDFANTLYGNKMSYPLSIEEFAIESEFDLVFALEVLEHLHSPIEVIRKTSKLLKKGGYFCGTTPFPFLKNIYADKTHLFVLRPENWKRLFIENGYKRVDLYPMSFIPFVWRINKRLNLKFPFFVPFPFFVSTCLIIAKK